MGLDTIQTRQHYKHTRRGKIDRVIDRSADLEDEKVATITDEDAWDNFVLLAKVCLLRDREATFYDVFDTWRVRLLSGWEFSPELIARVDAEIEEEERGRSRTV